MAVLEEGTALLIGPIDEFLRWARGKVCPNLVAADPNLEYLEFCPTIVVM